MEPGLLYRISSFYFFLFFFNGLYKVKSKEISLIQVPRIKTERQTVRLSLIKSLMHKVCHSNLELF